MKAMTAVTMPVTVAAVATTVAAMTAEAPMVEAAVMAAAVVETKPQPVMFSVQQKRAIADAIQNILRSTGHPELPSGEIEFHLHVKGAEEWSWADIHNNGAVSKPTVNPWNEKQDPSSTFHQSTKLA